MDGSPSVAVGSSAAAVGSSAAAVGSSAAAAVGSSAAAESSGWFFSVFFSVFFSKSPPFPFRLVIRLRLLLRFAIFYIL